LRSGGSVSGGIAAAFIAPFIVPFDRHGLEAPLVVGGMIILITLGGLMLGLSGLVISLLALIRIRKGGEDNRKKGMAIAGLVLNGLVIGIVLMLFGYIFLSNSPNPPPVMLTPSPLIPLPTGG